MPETIRVVILEDHQSTLDGYLYRLNGRAGIQVVATPTYGEELEPILAANAPVHVLLLDITVPTSAENDRPYPILHLLPKLRQIYPQLNALVISMHDQPALIRAVVDAGASGYVFKDDRATQLTLDSVIKGIAAGGVHFSKEAYNLIFPDISTPSPLTVRQMEVLALCATYPDKTTAEIAPMLGVADATVRNILSAIYLKLRVRSRTAAVARAEELGVFAAPEVYKLLHEIPPPGPTK